MALYITDLTFALCIKCFCPFFQDAYPKGEIFLGYKDDGYSVELGAPKNCKDQVSSPVTSMYFCMPDFHAFFAFVLNFLQ